MTKVGFGMWCGILVAANLVSGLPAFGDSCCKAGPESVTAYTSESLFNLKSVWTNQAGQVVSVDSLRGKPHVVGMFFAHCSTICPRLVGDIRMIEQALPEDIRENVGFVLISLDPARDTPEALEQFRIKMDLGQGRWQLWQGHPGNVRAMAAALGISYRMLPGGDVAHSAPIILLNENGEVEMRIENLSDSREPLIQHIKERGK